MLDYVYMEYLKTSQSTIRQHFGLRIPDERRTSGIPNYFSDTKGALHLPLYSGLNYTWNLVFPFPFSFEKQKNFSGFGNSCISRRFSTSTSRHDLDFPPGRYLVDFQCTIFFNNPCYICNSILPFYPSSTFYLLAAFKRYVSLLLRHDPI